MTLLYKTIWTKQFTITGHVHRELQGECYRSSAQIPALVPYESASTLAYQLEYCTYAAVPLEMSLSETRSSMSSEPCDSPDITSSHLLSLPQELRTLCFHHLLTSKPENDVTYGKGSGLDLSILSVCKFVHDEVLELLYSNVHRIKIPCSSGRCKNHPNSSCCKAERKAVNMPPYRALRCLKRVVLEVNFETSNRGECETSIIEYQDLSDRIIPLSMTLPYSTCLRSLTIGLFNHAQRKVGNRRLRTSWLLREMKWLLRPFAYIPREIPVLIDGFDTIEYAELFEALRDEYAGKNVPVIDWIEETLNMDVSAGPFGEDHCT